MADSAMVAVVQLQWKRYQSELPLRDELTRFLRVARTKGAALAVFPELTGLMVAGPLAVEKQETLKKKGGLLNRLLNSLGGAPELADALPMLVQEHSTELTNHYTRLFGELAYEHRMIIVGGTLLAQGGDGVVQYRAGVFDVDGNLMGWQTKFHLTEDEASLAEPGETLQTFDAPFGRFGVLIGHDLLFPELARALAFRGCVGIVNPTLARSPDSWRRQRLVANARAQENQMFVAQSFLVGTNDIFVGDSGPLMGKSALLAPVELSPRGDALLADVGTDRVESVVVGEWNVQALENLWRSSDVPVRSMVRGPLYRRLLAFDYESGATIAERTGDVEAVAELPAPDPQGQDNISSEIEVAVPEPEFNEAIAPALPLPLPVAPTVETDVPPETPAREDEMPPETTEAEEPAAMLGADDFAAEANPVVDAPEVQPTPVNPFDASATRTVPVIDPDTGRYLGERPTS